MSLDTTQPPLAPNAAKEKGGNLDGILSAQTLDLPELLGLILLELRVMNQILCDGFNLTPGTPDSYRNDPEISKVR